MPSHDDCPLALAIAERVQAENNLLSAMSDMPQLQGYELTAKSTAELRSRAVSMALQFLEPYTRTNEEIIADLIIIDEPTEGLAPKIVELVGQYLQTIKSRGISVLLIEQKLTIAMKISDRALVMGHGSIVFQGTPDSLRADSYIRKEWLEV